MSISTGLYPNLDLYNANKLHYITLHSYALSDLEYDLHMIYILQA